MKKEKDVHRRKVEHVYIGASLILNEFPDVRTISEKVLKVFREFPPNLSVRFIRHFVKSFRDIQYGKVRSNNIPNELLKKVANFDYNKWQERSDFNEVEIAELPPRGDILEVCKRSQTYECL